MAFHFLISWAYTAPPVADTGALIRDSAYVKPAGKELPVHRLKDKVVTASSPSALRSKKISFRRLTLDEFRLVVENQGDPVRVVSTLPGINNLSDENARPFVRGGNAGETKIFLDKAPLLHPFHTGNLYSLFNMESIAKLEFYTGSFPVETRTALSGVLIMHSKPPPLDTFSLFTDLSLLRGHVYTGIPLIKGKLGASFSYQAFWYKTALKYGWKILSRLKNNEGFDREDRAFESLIELPNFKDLQAGLRFRPFNDLDLRYTYLRSLDKMLTKGEDKVYLINGEEVSRDEWDYELFFRENDDTRLSTDYIIDTLAEAGINYDFHHFRSVWKPNPNLALNLHGAYQERIWNVHFEGGDDFLHSLAPPQNFIGNRWSEGNDKYDLTSQFYTADLCITYTGLGEHTITGGASVERLDQKYNTRLPRSLYEMVIEGNVDALNTIGYYDPEGFSINSKHPLANSDIAIDYLEFFIQSVKFNFKGSFRNEVWSYYLSDTWPLTAKDRLDYGVRLEYEAYTEEPFLSPRLSYYREISPRQEISLGSGLYSQNSPEFYQWETNKKLKSEKAFHLNADWTYAISNNITLELQNYLKYYYHLISPKLVAEGEIDWNYVYDRLNIKRKELNRWGVSKDWMEYLISDKKFEYGNSGVGVAAGVELSLLYKPKMPWRGWLSIELCHSRRQDHPGESWYSYRYSRPWSFKWTHTFFLKNNYELSFKSNYMAGFPYTGFETYVVYGSHGHRFAETETGTYLNVGPRNRRRYAPYSRVDLRLLKTGALFGREVKSYLGVWNVFAKPNFILRDSRTKQFKFAELNYPFPILFTGMQFRW